MISLGVSDMSRSVQFYSETLGLELAGPQGEVTVLRAGDVIIALNRPLGQSAGGAMAGAVEVVFRVSSVAEAHRLLADRGCTFIRQPREIFPGNHAATFTDPDGHHLTLLGPE
ncbi:MAG TPA: VOC family protein [Bryobacteraceae bacterium]|nr:VOC family protein [Bryobacteraceae bacterium]